MQKKTYRCKIIKVKYKLTVYFNLKKKISSSSANYKSLVRYTAQTQSNNHVECPSYGI